MTIVTILSIWLTSCTSTPKSSPAVPDVKPPDPYDANGELIPVYIAEDEVFTATTDGVFLPFWYYAKVFDYIVDSQAALEIARGEYKTQLEK